MVNKMAISEFYPVTLGKNERGRGPRCPPIVSVTQIGH